MGNPNIKYEKGMVKSTVTAILAEVNKLNTQNTEAYIAILSAFERSKCDEAESVRTQIAKEQDAVKMLTFFYQKLLHMVLNASHDMDHVEDSYATEHVTK